MLRTHQIATLIDRLIQHAHEVAPQTKTDMDRFDALRFFAEDVRNWLDRQPEIERQTLLQTMEQYRRDGATPGITTPQDAQVDRCLKQLLALILDPPPLLL